MSATAKLLEKAAQKAAAPEPTLDEELGAEAAQPEAAEAEASDPEPEDGQIAVPTDKTQLHKLNKDEVGQLHAQLGSPVEGFDALNVADKKKALIGVLFDGGAAPAVTKDKAAPAKKVVGEVLGNDELHQVAHEIEGLKDQAAIEAQITSLIDSEGLNDFRLGGLLIRLDEVGEFGEFDGFRDYVEAKYGMKYRKARYLMAIYAGLLKAGVPWVKVKEVGWTKLRIMLSIIDNENVDDWVQKALSMNAISLEEAVKQAQLPAPKDGGKANPAKDTSVKTKTFKLHRDQKEIVDEAVAKAKTQAGTEHDAVALEFIALEFLGAGPTGKKEAKAASKEAAAAAAPTEAAPIDYTDVDYAELAKTVDMEALFRAISDASNEDTDAAMQRIFVGFDKVFPAVELKLEY